MLDQVRIAKPCPASWEGMTGDDRVRFCELCRLNVYNLSAMSREEAEALVAGREGRLCVRLYKRADGTVLTEDCPVGLAAVKRRVAAVAASVMAFFSVAAASVLGLRAFDAWRGSKIAIVEPVEPHIRTEMGDIRTETGDIAGPLPAPK